MKQAHMGAANTFTIDVPDSHNPDGPWICVDTYPTRQEAVAAARTRFGADAAGRITLVSALPEDLDEAAEYSERYGDIREHRNKTPDSTV